MAQFYTLEEAAKALGMNPDDLKAKAQHREIRAFMDSGSWRFRVADIDELARRRGLGSDPELSLSDLDLDAPSIASGSGEFNLSEFQLGSHAPDLGQHTSEVPHHRSEEQDVLLDDMHVADNLGSGSGSSSTILGMKGGGKLPSDSDVRLVSDFHRGASDSDVRLAPMSSRGPGDSDVTLVKDEASLSDFPAIKPGEAHARHNPLIGSSAEVPIGSGSDFELTPSSVVDALQPESGSDFELTALDPSDEFDATPLSGPGDSDVTAAGPAASGINLSRPSDSGINLGGVGGFNLDAGSIELAPLEEENPNLKGRKPAPKPAGKAEPAKPKPSLAATPPPSVAKGEKDIFDDTDFEVDAIDSDTDDRTMQLQTGGSDFDLDDSDSASEVFAIDEDDVDENAATSMAAAVTDEEQSDEFDTSEMSSGWDVENAGSAASSAGSASVSPAMISTRGGEAEWSGLWVGFLVVTFVLAMFVSFVGIDLMRNLYEFRGGPASGSGLVKGLAGLFPK